MSREPGHDDEMRGIADGVAISGLPRTEAVLRDLDDTQRSIELALARSRVIAQGLGDLTEALRCVTTLLDRLKPWVGARMIHQADLAQVAQSINALSNRCRELEQLASAAASAVRVGRLELGGLRAFAGIGHTSDAR